MSSQYNIVIVHKGIQGVSYDEWYPEVSKSVHICGIRMAATQGWATPVRGCVLSELITQESVTYNWTN
jgi:hypothetical protein